MVGAKTPEGYQWGSVRAAKVLGRRVEGKRWLVSKFK